MHAIVSITSQKFVFINVELYSDFGSWLKWEICFANLGIWHKTISVFCNSQLKIRFRFLSFRVLFFAHSILCRMCCSISLYVYLNGKWMAIREFRWTCVVRSIGSENMSYNFTDGFPTSRLSKNINLISREAKWILRFVFFFNNLEKIPMWILWHIF